MAEKIFYVKREENIICEMVQEYMNDRHKLHYMLMADISTGVMEMVNIEEFTKLYYILTSSVLSDNKSLRKAYFNNLKTGMIFDAQINNKVVSTRNRLKKKYPDNDNKMGFKK